MPDAENSPFDYKELIPTISVDRAIGHLVTDLSVSIEQLTEYYESIPVDEKPNLSDLHIHFSALAVEDRHEYTTGSIIFGGTSVERQNVTPELQPPTSETTVILFIGSAIRNSTSMKKVRKKISEALTHELAHYVNGEDKEERRVKYEHDPQEKMANTHESKKTEIVTLELRKKRKKLAILTVNDESLWGRVTNRGKHRRRALRPPVG